MSIGVKTGIGWTDSTQNFLAGCKAIDPGCDNCYAKNVAQRLANMPNEKIKAKYLPTVQNGEWTGKITITEKELIAPLRTPKSSMIFVNSMSDLFYEEVPDEVIDRQLVVMYLAKWQFFQVLTKRQKRLKEYFENLTDERLLEAILWLCRTFDIPTMNAYGSLPKPDSKTPEGYFVKTIASMENVIWMVSASNQRGLEIRVPALLETPYLKYRGVSLEPLIGEVNLDSVKGHLLDWIIVGGESSKRLSEDVRPMNSIWFSRVRSFCEHFEVPLFFKQWGDWLPVDAWNFPKYKGEWQLVQGNGIRHRNQTWEQAKSVAGYTQAFMKVGKDKAGNEWCGQKFEQFPPIKFGEYLNYWQKKR